MQCARDCQPSRYSVVHRGNFAWLVFYATFVAAVAVHAPIGMRTILSETLRLRGAHVDIAVLLLGVVLALWGWRAVFAVFQ
jgi:fumarate reductase subunit C